MKMKVRVKVREKVKVNMGNVLHTVFQFNECQTERENERENEKCVAYCGHQCSIFWLRANDKS